MNGAGCVYAEGLSNTAVGAQWSGGNADGFAQNYLGTYDIGSHACATPLLITASAPPLWSVAHYLTVPRAAS